MKKLNKLSINPEKVIKNNELVNLRGGYEPGEPCTCTCVDSETTECLGYVFAPDGKCLTACSDVYGPDAIGACGNYPYYCGG